MQKYLELSGINSTAWYTLLVSKMCFGINIKYNFHTLTLTVVIIVVGFCFIFITSFSFDDVPDTLGFKEHQPCDWASLIQNDLRNEQMCKTGSNKQVQYKFLYEQL